MHTKPPCTAQCSKPWLALPTHFKLHYKASTEQRGRLCPSSPSPCTAQLSAASPNHPLTLYFFAGPAFWSSAAHSSKASSEASSSSSCWDPSSLTELQAGSQAGRQPGRQAGGQAGRRAGGQGQKAGRGRQALVIMCVGVGVNVAGHAQHKGLNSGEVCAAARTCHSSLPALHSPIAAGSGGLEGGGRLGVAVGAGGGLLLGTGGGQESLGLGHAAAQHKAEHGGAKGEQEGDAPAVDEQVLCTRGRDGCGNRGCEG